MKPIARDRVNLEDTFDILAALPEKSSIRKDPEAFERWLRESAINLSIYFTGQRGLSKMWESVLNRYLEFWWTIERYNILLLYEQDFVREKIVYGILGQSPRSCLIRANDMRRVLVLGETGTGKETIANLFARSLVDASVLKSPEAFACLSAAEFTDTLLQSEMFGYKKGSHGGALEDYEGILGTMPDQGVLFLDEIGEASGRFQAELLRVIQTGEYRPVGSPVPHKKYFHFVGATNLDEATLATGSKLRRDLYYRISQHVVTMPPLRSLVIERRKARRVFDALFRYESQQFARHVERGMNGSQSIQSIDSLRSVDEEAVLLSMLKGNFLEEFDHTRVPGKVEELMRGYPWPGNLRECSNLMRRIIQDGPDSVERHCHMHREAVGQKRLGAGDASYTLPTDLKAHL